MLEILSLEILPYSVQTYISKFFIILLTGNINVSIFSRGLFLAIWKKLMTSKFARAMARFFAKSLLYS